MAEAEICMQSNSSVSAARWASTEPDSANEFHVTDDLSDNIHRLRAIRINSSLRSICFAVLSYCRVGILGPAVRAPTAPRSNTCLSTLLVYSPTLLTFRPGSLTDRPITANGFNPREVASITAYRAPLAAGADDEEDVIFE